MGKREFEVKNAKEDDANGWYKPQSFPEIFRERIKRDPARRATWEKRLVVKSGVSLEKWTDNFDGRDYYINEKGYIISYNNRKQTWALMTPNKTKGVKGGAGQRIGHAIYKVKDTMDRTPPVQGWKRHCTEVSSAAPRVNARGGATKKTSGGLKCRYKEL